MACQNPEYQRFCAKTYKYIPCCKEIDSNNLSCVLFSEDDSGGLKLIHQFFELREIFLQKKMIKFHAQGICMYPSIRLGDILHIEPKKAEQIKIGDIAVYRRSSHLFGHRTIDKGDNDGLAYIVTRPDTARFGNDGPSFDQDILGIVSSIERRGEILDTAKKEYNLLKKMSFSVFLKCYYIRQHLFSKLIYVVNYMQQFNAYRKIAKFLFLNKKANFSIRVPLNIKVADRFNREISPQELIDLNLGMDKSSISKWKIALDINSRQAASMSFIFRPDTCPFPGWWLADAKIMIRYRGTKIEEELFARAKELLRQSGISRVYACAFKDAYFERMLFKNNLPLVRVIMERKF